MKMKDNNKMTRMVVLRYIRCLAGAHSLSSDGNMALPCSRILAAQACSYGF